MRKHYTSVIVNGQLDAFTGFSLEEDSDSLKHALRRASELRQAGKVAYAAVVKEIVPSDLSHKSEEAVAIVRDYDSDAEEKSLQINACVARAILLEALRAKFEDSAGRSYAKHDDTRAAWYRGIADEMRIAAGKERAKQAELSGKGKADETA